MRLIKEVQELSFVRMSKSVPHVLSHSFLFMNHFFGVWIVLSEEKCHGKSPPVIPCDLLAIQEILK